ncbi:hypothetical protein KGF57_002600 [Candida theae]|uniref:Palmitoyl-protein thioesterase 1 n=1 Tax=Candida theae TaxID=1198502 RepID=A0AAD5FYS2_9ASCO|nr:uncharacterized protein KGF57_002600 [Candida theae]KAI5958245.1 hypothetical protein KGF57_002600 [Candida theae]
MHISTVINFQVFLSYLSNAPPRETYRPVILWHGLGDNYNASGIHEVNESISGLYPGIFFHSIYIDEDPSTDQQKSLFGDANKQVDQVCDQLRGIKELATAEGIDAIGFSQGGVLLRGLIERCSHLSFHNLITFGSPHMGVMEMPLCKDPRDWICKRRNELLKRQVWNDNVQKRVLPAQYFRDPFEYEKYLKHSLYLADVNNERKDKNATYVENLTKLNKLVLVTFTEDTTVVPKESAMFCDIDTTWRQTIPFDKTDLYIHDYIGIRYLHEMGRIDFRDIEAEHMSISDEFIEEIALNYLGNK